MSEWARSALLAATTPTPSNPSNQNQDAAVLGKVRALRAIVLNLFFDLANGEESAVDRMKEIIAKANAKKAGSKNNITEVHGQTGTTDGLVGW